MEVGSGSVHVIAPANECHSRGWRRAGTGLIRTGDRWDNTGESCWVSRSWESCHAWSAVTPDVTRDTARALGQTIVMSADGRRTAVPAAAAVGRSIRNNGRGVPRAGLYHLQPAPKPPQTDQTRVRLWPHGPSYSHRGSLSADLHGFSPERRNGRCTDPRVQSLCRRGDEPFAFLLFPCRELSDFS
jgi:hypothetical protein